MLAVGVRVRTLVYHGCHWTSDVLFAESVRGYNRASEADAAGTSYRDEAGSTSRWWKVIAIALNRDYRLLWMVIIVGCCSLFLMSDPGTGRRNKKD